MRVSGGYSKKEEEGLNITQISSRLGVSRMTITRDFDDIMWIIVHGFTSHGFTVHGFASHGFTAHGFTSHGFTGHGFTVHGFLKMLHSAHYRFLFGKDFRCIAESSRLGDSFFFQQQVTSTCFKS